MSNKDLPPLGSPVLHNPTRHWGEVVDTNEQLKNFEVEWNDGLKQWFRNCDIKARIISVYSLRK
jgi:hypothetical protein